MPDHKILIIKTGYSEVLDRESNSRKVSLGDILRTTVLLNLYRNDDVAWVSDESAFPLLEGNPFIKRLLPYDFTTAMQLGAEEFDTVINLEKIPGICALANNVQAWRKYGFRFDRKTGRTEAYDRSFDVIAISSDPGLKKTNRRSYQELIFEMVGAKWQGEEYILGHAPKSKEENDILLNTEIGQKWPTKAWPRESWDRLESMLAADGLRVVRQDRQPKEILTNLYNYMDWINSSRITVSNDSLGMHLALALKKNVIGLFGPTPFEEVHFYNRGAAIFPNPVPECMPCFSPKCANEKNCMGSIAAEDVYIKVKDYLK